MNLLDILLKKRHWPRWLLIPEIFLVISFLTTAGLAVWLHKQFGGSMFGCCIVSTTYKGSLFWASHLPDSSSLWWHGLGYTWWNLFFWPFMIYFATRGTLIIARVAARGVEKLARGARRRIKWRPPRFSPAPGNMLKVSRFVIQFTTASLLVLLCVPYLTALIVSLPLDALFPYTVRVLLITVPAFAGGMMIRGLASCRRLDPDEIPEVNNPTVQFVLVIHGLLLGIATLAVLFLVPILLDDLSCGPGGELPRPTQLLLDMSDAFRAHFLLTVPLAIAALWADGRIYRALYQTYGRKVGLSWFWGITLLVTSFLVSILWAISGTIRVMTRIYPH